MSPSDRSSGPYWNAIQTRLVASASWAGLTALVALGAVWAGSGPVALSLMVGAALPVAFAWQRARRVGAIVASLQADEARLSWRVDGVRWTTFVAEQRQQLKGHLVMAGMITVFLTVLVQGPLSELTGTPAEAARGYAADGFLAAVSTWGCGAAAQLRSWGTSAMDPFAEAALTEGAVYVGGYAWGLRDTKLERDTKTLVEAEVVRVPLPAELLDQVEERVHRARFGRAPGQGRHPAH